MDNITPVPNTKNDLPTTEKRNSYRTINISNDKSIKENLSVIHLCTFQSPNYI